MSKLIFHLHIIAYNLKSTANASWMGLHDIVLLSQLHAVLENGVSGFSICKVVSGMLLMLFDIRVKVCFSAVLQGKGEAFSEYVAAAFCAETRVNVNAFTRK